MITVSIVSHRHGDMVVNLLDDLSSYSEVGKIILTYNVREPEILLPEKVKDRVLVINNNRPKGYGANHNQAFAYSESSFFCVLNPDIRIRDNPFSVLISKMRNNVALSAPLICDQRGEVEDSARRFPTPIGMIYRLIGIDNGVYQVKKNGTLIKPDWVAGMFMLFKKEDYALIGGFDESYFLYVEDVDLCYRLRNSGREIVLCPDVEVIHCAQRASHRNLKYFIWHISGLVRFITNVSFKRSDSGFFSSKA